MKHTEYKTVGRVLNRLHGLEKPPKIIANKINNSIPSVREMIEVMEDQGLGRLAQSSNKIITLLNNIVTQLEDGKITSYKEYTSKIKEIINLHSSLNPEKNTKEESKIDPHYEDLNKSTVTLKVAKDKLMALAKAPIFLVSATKIKGRNLKILKMYNAHFYSNTNGISIPNVPILVLNLDIVDQNKLKQLVPQILNQIRPNDPPVPFYSLMERKRNLLAIPCFKKEHTPIFQDFFEKTNGIKLLIK